MNLYKKISRLEKQIENLRKENKKLKEYNQELLQSQNKCEEELSKSKIKYETKLKIADEKCKEYCELIEELNKEKKLYETLIAKVKFMNKKIKSNYKKEFSEIKKDIKV